MDVLVVDDDPDIRTTLAELLRDEGYAVEELAGASGLCDLLDEHRPRLVLLDLTLPGKALETVLAEAHERQLLTRTTVLALSGLEDAAEIALQLGLDGSVRKPFEIEPLLACVARICRPDDGQAQPSSPHAHY